MPVNAYWVRDLIPFWAHIAMVNKNLKVWYSIYTQEIPGSVIYSPPHNN